MRKAFSIKNISAFLLAACLMPAAMAQYVTNYKRAADQFYAKGDYYSAAQYYEKYLDDKAPGGPAYDPYLIQKQAAGKQPAERNAAETNALQYRLAESYRLVNDYTDAEAWYKKVAQSNAAAFPLVHYYYAVCLRAAGKYNEAQPELETFLQQYKTADSRRAQAEQELANIIFIQQQLSAADKSTAVTKLSNTINKEGASYAGTWLNDGTLVFTSTHPGSDAKASYVNALYQTSLQGEQFGEVQQLAVPALKDKEQGVATATPDGKKLFFTAWSTDKEGKKHAAIYATDKKDNSWSAPIALGSNINVEGSDSRQPQVTGDGKYLLFASDRPGGKGGFDVWYAPLKNGEPGKAVNAGAVINTKSDEQAPFYHTASQTLVFASNGRTGMGGFDLYAAAGSWKGPWAEPQNLGYPVNSVKDDIYFTSRGERLLENAWLSSDRGSACCLELFSVNKTYKEYIATTVIDSVVPEKKPDIFAGKKTLVTHNIHFAFRKKDLTTDSYVYLDEVVAYLKENEAGKLEIDAHTDGIGTTAFNLHLSQQRAEACVEYLVKAGIARERLVAKGYGECCPLEKEHTAAGKDNPAAREKNRRVEMKLLN